MNFKNKLISIVVSLDQFKARYQLKRALSRHNIFKLFLSLVKINLHKQSIIKKCSDFSMTSKSRLEALFDSVNYVVENNIAGAFVECGVWRGGSSMVMALTLLAKKCHSREIFLYDTFEGMPKPSENDVSIDGISASQFFDEDKKKGIPSSWSCCYASEDEVKKNMFNTGYPSRKIHFIKGKVEQTLPKFLPGSIALLRLDTDWYESTKHELNHLFPLLQKGGVLIIDDYGAWKGAKKAVDEYFSDLGLNLPLFKIDYTARLAIKN